MTDTNKTDDASDGGLHPMTCSPLLEYQPESWSMLKDTIYSAQAALRNGIDYAEELLAKKDWELGREHKSNRDTAELMEREIAAMRMALIGLGKPNGCSYADNPEMREIIYEVSTGGYTPMQAHEWLKSHPENAIVEARGK